MNKKIISLILLLLIGIGVNAEAADNVVKTSFATMTVPDGWKFINPQKTEYYNDVTCADVNMKQKSTAVIGPRKSYITISRYDTGKTAKIEGTKFYVERMLMGYPMRKSDIKWEFDKTRNMWKTVYERMKGSYERPDDKIARKDMVYLLQNGKYIDVFWVELTKSAVNDPEIAKQIDAIFKSWTPKPVKK